MKAIDPKNYNLSSRTKLFKNSKGSIFIGINRKSRIIMKDGQRIIDIARCIKKIEKVNKINLLTSAPICSKTTKFLSQNNILVIKP